MTNVTGGAPQTTNNRMELSAVIEALRVVNSIPDWAKDAITVRSDSEYVSNAFNQNWIPGWRRNNWRDSRRQPVANRELWEIPLEQTRSREITWEWVNVHSGDWRRKAFVSP